MAASLFDSQLYGSLVSSGDAGRLFSDSAEVRAMLLVLGAFAKAQGARGLIPAESAAAIGRAVVEVAIDPGALRKETAREGTPVPALIAALRSEMNAPEHAQFVNWGTAVQDVTDTALMLRLRQILNLLEADLKLIADLLTNKGISSSEIVSLLGALPDLRASYLCVSFSGDVEAIPANVLPDIRAALAEGLALANPKRDWHNDREGIYHIIDWLQNCSDTLVILSNTKEEPNPQLRALILQSRALVSTVKTGPQFAELLCLPHIALSACATAYAIRKSLQPPE